MKRIDAVIPQKNLNVVDKALRQSGVTGITLFNTKGRGKITPEPMYAFGPGFFYPEFGDNHTIMVLTKDGDVDRVVQSIKESAGAGKIIITNVENLVDIRQNRKGEQAL